jgi:hypothetical protein
MMMTMDAIARADEARARIDDDNDDSGGHPHMATTP